MRRYRRSIFDNLPEMIEMTAKMGAEMLEVTQDANRNVIVRALAGIGCAFCIGFVLAIYVLLFVLVIYIISFFF